MGKTLKNRRKCKDNPYKLVYSETSKKYYVIFQDHEKKLHNVEISEMVFNAFDSFELEDISQMHEFERHIEHSEIFEETLYARTMVKPVSLEQEVETRLLHSELLQAINQLSDVQKRRIKMYYFQGMNLRKIAEREKCSIMAVKESIDTGITKLKKFLKK